MTDATQFFITYNGDSQNPGFSVYSDITKKTPLDISGAANIILTAQRDLESPIILTKQKTNGGIVWADASNGEDGRFAAVLVAADTANLSGFYYFVAVIIDAFGNASTVSAGRWQVGPGPLWTYSGDPRVSDKDAVRFLIGDTVWKDQLINDPEILFALTQRTSTKGAAADCCRAIAARLSREVDSVDAQLRTMWSSRARQFSARAFELDAQAKMGGGGAMPYAGGISISDRSRDIQNTDRVQPEYVIGADDNLNAPVAPVGHEKGR